MRILLMEHQINKKTIDDWLEEVNYGSLLGSEYVPSQFALEYITFIKLVNGTTGESNKSPPMHMKMLDGIIKGKTNIVNLCFRGAAKTSLFIEYLSLYIATFGELPGLGKVEGMLYISDSMDNGAKTARKNIEYRYHNSEFLKKYVPKATFTDSYIEFVNISGHRLGIKLFGAKSGIRGTKIFGKRPVLAILDDLLSDDDARSPTVIAAIKDTIYRGVNHALDPKRRKTIMSGTPFNQEDPMIEAVESGTWEVNVYPVCEQFPCDKADFVGAWEDRFDYNYVLDQYNLALSVGQVDGFYQELMLRINTSENRKVEEHDIRWYKRDDLLKHRDRYNFYITSDFATSSKKRADFTVISVWAYSHTGNWFWVDGICKQQTMEKTINDLFSLVQEYKPQSVGIEVSGQQGAFIQWIQNEMLARNSWFNLASDKNSSNPGIRPVGDKASRFDLVVPLFKTGKIAFPLEWKTSTLIGQFLKQLRLVTFKGIKGKDDCLDTISMLALLSPWKPYNYSVKSDDTNSPFDKEARKEVYSGLDNYIV